MEILPVEIIVLLQNLFQLSTMFNFFAIGQEGLFYYLKKSNNLHTSKDIEQTPYYSMNICVGKMYWRFLLMSWQIGSDTNTYSKVTKRAVIWLLICIYHKLLLLRIMWWIGVKMITCVKKMKLAIRVMFLKIGKLYLLWLDRIVGSISLFKICEATSFLHSAM